MQASGSPLDDARPSQRIPPKRSVSVTAQRSFKTALENAGMWGMEARFTTVDYWRVSHPTSFGTRSASWRHLQQPNAAPSTNNQAAAGSGTVALDAELSPTVRPKLARHRL